MQYAKTEPKNHFKYGWDFYILKKHDLNYFSEFGKRDSKCKYPFHKN